MIGSGQVAAECTIDPTHINSFASIDSRYELVRDRRPWADAAACASDRNGQLVQIESESEQSLVWSAILATPGVNPSYASVPDGGNVGYVWIGATDQANEGTWIWDGDGDGSGETFWTGKGLLAGGDGEPETGAFHNWGGSTFWGGLSGLSTNEPDDSAGQDAAAIALDEWPTGAVAPIGIAGEWNDISTSNALYFIIEYELDTDGDGIVNRLDPDDDNDGYDDEREILAGTDPKDGRDNPGIRAITTSVLPVLLD
jgi:hypothetical protein